jgi:MYXO-CTERM domain-containing protein
MNKLSLTCAALTTALTASLSMAATATFDYQDLADTSGLLILKNAMKTNTAIDGPVIRLTPSFPNMSGVVEAQSKVATANFETQFTWRATNIGGLPDAGAQLGSDGFYLSLGSSNQLQPGYLPVLNNAAVQIHFDTYQNGGDPSSNFVSATINGQRVATGTVARPFDNGELWYAWVEYNGTDLNVYAAHEETHPLRPAITLHNLNLNALLGSEAYAAIGAKGEGGFANQDLVSWSFHAVPTPGAAALLGVGGLVAGRRRRA